MSIAAISAGVSPQVPQASTSPSSSWKEFLKERKADLNQLGDALQSGNLNGAQQAYSDLVTLAKQLGNRGNGVNPFLRSDRQLDFNAIGGALQNGDLAGAEQAFTTLEDTFHVVHPLAGSGSVSATPVEGSGTQNPTGGVDALA